MVDNESDDAPEEPVARLPSLDVGNMLLLDSYLPRKMLNVGIRHFIK